MCSLMTNLIVYVNHIQNVPGLHSLAIIWNKPMLIFVYLLTHKDTELATTTDMTNILFRLKANAFTCFTGPCSAGYLPWEGTCLVLSFHWEIQFICLIQIQILSTYVKILWKIHWCSKNKQLEVLSQKPLKWKHKLSSEVYNSNEAGKGRKWSWTGIRTSR